MIQYRAGYKYVDRGVHAQVLDFPAAITCGDDFTEARRLLASALLDVAQTRLELGKALPNPNSQASDPEMDLEEPVYLHLSVSTDVVETPAGEVASCNGKMLSGICPTRLRATSRRTRSFRMG